MYNLKKILWPYAFSEQDKLVCNKIFSHKPMHRFGNDRKLQKRIILELIYKLYQLTL